MRTTRIATVLALVCIAASPSAAHARLDPGQAAPPTGPEVLAARPAAGSTAPTRGVWPLRPRPEVAEPFDAPTRRWGAGHRGADLVGRVGQPVRAAMAGTVGFVGRIAGIGIVVVDHGRTRTTYQPVLATVARGRQVAAGDVVGHLLGSGSHCAPRACLHWGLRRGETYLDPLTLVDAPRPVRLLPW